MKMKMKVLAAVCFLLLFLNVAQSRMVAGGNKRHHDEDDHGGHHHHGGDDGGDDDDDSDHGHHHGGDDDDHHGRHHGGDDDDDDGDHGHHHGGGDDDNHHGHHHGGGDDDNKKDRSTHKLFVFGDEFADVGNLASDESLGGLSKTWRFPFGMSDAAHGRKPTGRFSDGLVMSDYMAKILGHRESPPAYNGDGWGGDAVDPSGLNFAVGGAGVLHGTSAGVATLRDQVKQLRDLVRDGVVDDDKDLKESVALVAFSGNDYGEVDGEGFDALIPRVVDELESVAAQLLDLGVTKVVVSTLPPFGCSPWQARETNYSSCRREGDGPAAAKHNAALRDRLDGDEDVMVLDVYTVMMDMVAPPARGSEVSARFRERLEPCCETYDGEEEDHCGLADGKYWLCERPEEYFYWDFVNPTQAGWRAVMQLLQGPIMAFLGISQLTHF